MERQASRSSSATRSILSSRFTVRDLRIVRVDIIRAPEKVRAATSARWASASGGR